MNEIQQGKAHIRQTSEWIEVNGDRYYFPEHVKGRDMSLSMIDGVVLINGRTVEEFCAPKRRKLVLTPFAKMIVIMASATLITGILLLFYITFKFLFGLL